MHKIRNTKHQASLDSLVGTIAPGCSEPLSKRTLKKLCIIKKWDKSGAEGHQRRQLVDLLLRRLNSNR